VPRRERADRVEQALASVRLEGFGGRRPSQLSGGQRQRVALARALVNRPRVLLLDEPLGALDLKLRQEMQLELKALQREVGITFLFVTHDQEEALTMSDRVAVFATGRLEQVGPAREVYERPSSEFVAGFVGTANLLREDAARSVLGRVGTWSVRPERVRVGAEGSGAGGTVADVVFAGPVVRLVVDLDAGARFVVSVADDRTLPPGLARGQRVALSWDPEHVLRVG
jgi:putative spermidine/putrescine transport system ATP-binding protein